MGLRRTIIAIIVEVLSVSACGRLTEQVAAETIALPPEAYRLPDSPMLTAPTITRFQGDPTWALSREASDRIISSYSDSFIPGGSSDPEVYGYPRMPEACYAIEIGEGHAYPEDECLYPVLEQLVSQDALRFYRENGLMILRLTGAGPVKVADPWWGPFGTNDSPQALIFTPDGFMSAAPEEWAPYANAVREALTSETFARIYSITGGWGLQGSCEGEGECVTIAADQPGITAYWFYAAYPNLIQPPRETQDGWSVVTTRGISSGCHACGVGFAALFVLEFSSEGTPMGARFDGFCYDDRADDWRWEDATAKTLEAIESLRAEVPTCDSEQWIESALGW